MCFLSLFGDCFVLYIHSHSRSRLWWRSTV